jgi:hypothetical protein
MNYVVESSGALVNEKGVEQPLKAGDFALVNSGEASVPEQSIGSH